MSKPRAKNPDAVALGRRGGAVRWRGAVAERSPTGRKNRHAVALGRKGARKGGLKGGPKGGKARWKGVSAEERSELMRKAVRARWQRAKKAKP